MAHRNNGYCKISVNGSPNTSDPTEAKIRGLLQQKLRVSTNWYFCSNPRLDECGVALLQKPNE